jgi:oligopeptidase B
MRRVRGNLRRFSYGTKSKLKNLFKFKSNTLIEPNVYPEDGRMDPFAYLHELDDPRTEALIAGEQLYATQYIMSANMKKRYTALDNELNFLLNSAKAKISAQEYNNGYLYIQMEANYKLPVYMRLKTDDPQLLKYDQVVKRFSEFKVVLDQNVIYNDIPGVTYFYIHKIKLSYDQSTVLYLLDLSGEEKYDIGIREVVTGREIDRIENVAILNAEFSPSGKEIYYTVADSLKRPFKVMKHVLGENQGSDVEIFEERDTSMFVDLSKTKDNKYVTINVNSKSTSEIHVIDENGVFRLIQARINGTSYFLEHNKGTFYLVTNADDSTNFKVVRTRSDAPGKENWIDFIPSGDKVRIEDLDMFEHHLCLYEKQNGISRIRTIDLTDKSEYIAEPPIQYSTISPGMNANPLAKKVYFSYSNPLHDDQFASIDLDSMSVQECQINAEREVLSKYVDPALYAIERVNVRSQDNVYVPMTIVTSRLNAMDGSSPAIIYGYGAYGQCQECIP